MDCIYPEYLEKVIHRQKNAIKYKMDNLNLTAENLSLHSDMICMILEYSPVIQEVPILFGKQMTHLEKICLKDNHWNEDMIGPQSSRSLTLERKTSHESEDGFGKQVSKVASKILYHRKSSSRKGSISASHVFIQNILNSILERVNEAADDKLEMILVNNDYKVYGYLTLQHSYHSSNSSNKINLHNLIRVYLFNTETFIDLHYCQTDTFYDLKKKILDQIKNDELIRESIKVILPIEGKYRLTN
jgi:hypothetical protein